MGSVDGAAETSGIDNSGISGNVSVIDNGFPFPYIHNDYSSRNSSFSMRQRLVRQYDKLLKFLCLILDNDGEGDCHFSLTVMHLNRDQVNDNLRKCQLTQWCINPTDNLVVTRWDILLNLLASLDHIGEKQFFKLYKEER